MDEKSVPPERMADFFDVRSGGYDEDMRRSVSSFDQFYGCIASPIVDTKAKVRVLDIGCGTGLELEAILSKVPNAVVTGIDVSEQMLRRLADKYANYSKQMTLIKGSYLTVPFGEGVYDYAVAVMTLHHFVSDTKRKLYEKIRKALKRRGKYIEGDWVVSSARERQYLLEYEKKQRLEVSEEGSHHIDIPFSLETQTRLLLEAGFSKVDVIWHEDEAAIYVASV
jgi:tRNA (cmo5U34)-methyltransferase